ncbi:MAG: prolyl oligopeptidase family serine peptidase [Acidobacteria bacterium]|nr:prolyl oligopeptidase family serine peptidase [Acidobacteriota bacterium]
MLRWAFHRWEQSIHNRTTDRVVRDFSWGLDWLPVQPDSAGRAPADVLLAYAEQALADSSAFFAVTDPPSWDLDHRGHLTFESQLVTPHPENNVVHARLFRARDDRGRAVVVLPQWNADVGGHVGLCQLFNRVGLTALRLSLPYHDWRMPPELRRADYIVSSNVGRTLQVCRQAVLDARRAVAWLASQGYTSIGICGTSLGSCLAMLTAAHEPRIAAVALNHISPFFADVVWNGLSTRHVREALDGHVDLEALRRIWLPISPQSYLERVRQTRTLLIYAQYDLTFPLQLSRSLVREFRERQIPHQLAVLPCGHYSTGMTPFKYLDGYWLARFLMKALPARTQATGS